MNAEPYENSQQSAIVIDQSELFRLGVEKVLSDMDFLVKGSFARAADGFWLARTNPSGIVIVGKVADLKPKSALKALRVRKDAPRVVLLLEQASESDVALYLGLGVQGLLTRAATAVELARAIDDVSRGGRVVAPALTSGAVGRVGPKDEHRAAAVGLSPREYDVLGELAAGATYDEIAESLMVGKATVKTHLVHIYEKLDVKNRNEAVAKGLALGLLG